MAFYMLDDGQLWFHRMELNGGHPSMRASGHH
jgi:hypothetical protein